MGVVLAARHLTLGQAVAIKILTLTEDRQQDSVERFLREGRTAAALTSDHVVRIYDVGQTSSGVPFMVMECLRGKDLAAVLTEEGPLPVDLAVEYIAQATMAIAEAHEAGIIHRDLKPSNLFLTQRSDGSACIKVLDFGISKQLSMFDSQTLRADLTATRQVMGSPAYMSPEQVRDARNVDHRTDIWALGTTLYELLTRHVAFDADTLPAVCAAIAADPPTPIESHRTDVSPQVVALVMRCLEKVPDRRFPTARALLAALRGFQGRPDVFVSGREPFKPSVARLAAVPPVVSSSPALPNGATSSPAIKESGERQVSNSGPSEHVDDTLLSGRGVVPGFSPSNEAARDVAVASEGSANHGRKRRNALVMAGLGLFAVVTSVLVALRGATVSTERRAEDAFRLRLDSEPHGATVFEGDQPLGATPIELPITRSSVKEKSRRFVLRIPGYRDAQWVQGASPEDIRVQVSLAKDESAAPETTSSVGTPSGTPPEVAKDSPDRVRDGELPAATTDSTRARAAEPSPKTFARSTGKKNAASTGSAAVPSTTTPDIRTKR
jgi:serine/threonine-protein kinase